MLRIAYFLGRFKKSTFAQRVSATFLTKIGVVMLVFAYSIITARYLGPEGKGVLAILMVITGFVIQFGNFGLHASNVYFVAQDKRRLPKIAVNTLWVSLVGGSIISVFSLAILYFSQDLISGVPFILFLLVFLSVPFLLFYTAPR